MQIELDGNVYDVEVRDAGETLDTIVWLRRGMDLSLNLNVPKLDGAGTEPRLRDYLKWKLAYPWKNDTLVASSERLLDVDGEGVEFKVGLAAPSRTWDPNESKLHVPKVTLSARSNSRAKMLESPASKSRMSQYADDELRALWREKAGTPAR